MTKTGIIVEETGITARFDDLGRIVISREVRRRMGLAEGAAVEINLGTRKRPDGTEDRYILLQEHNSPENRIRHALAGLQQAVEGSSGISQKFRDEARDASRKLQALLEKERTD